MDQTTYQRWWALHLRVARGERLTAEEQAIYDAGCSEFDREELSKFNLTALKRAREALAALKTEEAHLREQSERLEAEITRLESAL
ncbi:MAG TPA: hypothetical protein VNK04_09110 [Gemmataceae bacterium]|nr:hypothetical protein [Gemmataceae bacterium]